VCVCVCVWGGGVVSCVNRSIYPPHWDWGCQAELQHTTSWQCMVVLSPDPMIHGARQNLQMPIDNVG